VPGPHKPGPHKLDHLKAASCDFDYTAAFIFSTRGGQEIALRVLHMTRTEGRTSDGQEILAHVHARHRMAGRKPMIAAADFFEAIGLVELDGGQ
jgi:hypothetical protein